MDIEAVTVQKEGRSKKVLKRGFYYRAHACDYQSIAQS